MTSSFARIACAALAVCCTALPSWAQGRPDRPYRGLFGGGDQFTQSLTASASTGIAFDNNLRAALASDDPALLTAKRQDRIQNYEYVSAGLSYSLAKSRANLGASLATSGQYVPGGESTFISNYVGSIGAGLQLSRRSNLTANYTVALQPYNVLVLGLPLGEPVLGQAAPLEPTFGIRRDEHISQASDIGFTRQIGRRASLGFGYGYIRSGGSSRGGDLTSWTGSGRFSMGLTKGLGAHFGYGYTEGHLPGETTTIVGHNIDAGLDFTRTLGISLSRRTKLSFSTGSGVLRDRQRTYFRLTGNAALTREIARTWVASLSYNRGMGFVERFHEPFFSDSLMLGVSGLIARRLSFQSSAGAVSGDVGLGTNSNAFRSYFGASGLTMGITRSLALGTDYTYYRYGFAQLDGLPTGVARQMGRHSARVYLSVWVPIMQRGRR